MSTNSALSSRSSVARYLLNLLLFFIALGFIWQIAIVVFLLPAYLVPNPLTVLAAFRTHYAMLLSHTAVTMLSAIVGLAVSTIFAGLAASAFVAKPRFEQATMPLLIFFRAAPVAAVAPIITLAIGRGIATSVVVVIIVSFFPLLINLMRGLRSGEKTVMELMHVYNASALQTLLMVRIPWALPYFFSGLRVAGTSAILGAMLSEWITGTRGLGLLILESGEMRDIDVLWAAVIISILLGLLVFWATSAAEQSVSKWRR